MTSEVLVCWGLVEGTASRTMLCILCDDDVEVRKVIGLIITRMQPTSLFEVSGVYRLIDDVVLSR